MFSLKKDTQEELLEHIDNISFEKRERGNFDFERYFVEHHWDQSWEHFLENVDDAPGFINICGYTIREKNERAFLQYFLLKDNEKGVFAIPSMPFEKKEDIQGMIQYVLYTYQKAYRTASPLYWRGYVKEGNDYYVFFDCSDMQIEGVRVNKNNDLWLVACDEIINRHHVCQYKICKNTIHFFMRNRVFLFLVNAKGDILEIPTVVYSSCNKKKLHFNNIFGTFPEEDELMLFGKYYYFYQYEGAFMDRENLGLVRTAVFLGNSKMIMSPNEEDDDSEVTRRLLKDETGENDEMVFKYRKISDRSGKWTEKYDSLFLSNIIDLNSEIDFCEPGDYVNNNYYVIKTHEQQFVLTTHLKSTTENAII
jgi:hypothetical protein